MNELFKFLIERMKNNPVGAQVLLLLGSEAAWFSLVYFFEKVVTPLEILQDYVFQAGAVFIVSMWLASICWKYARYRALHIVATSAPIIVGLITAIWIIQTAHIKQLGIRIVFDDSVDITPESLVQLQERLRSPLFNVEISDKPFPVVTATAGTITDREVRAALKEMGLLQPSNKTRPRLPVLITARMLKTEEWQNLLMLTWSDALAISVWNIGSNTSLSDTVVNRYLATSVAFATLESHAVKNRKVFWNRENPNLYKGCLSDFHRNRNTYVLQCQDPKLCGPEEKAIRRIFGRATVKELRNVFTRISQNSSSKPFTSGEEKR